MPEKNPAKERARRKTLPRVDDPVLAAVVGRWCDGDIAPTKRPSHNTRANWTVGEGREVEAVSTGTTTHHGSVAVNDGGRD